MNRLREVVIRKSLQQAELHSQVELVEDVTRAVKQGTAFVYDGCL